MKSIEQPVLCFFYKIRNFISKEIVMSDFILINRNDVIDSILKQDKMRQKPLEKRKRDKK